jgi:protein-S-isoprenylcysteine O-methyltransferase Ste14
MLLVPGFDHRLHWSYIPTIFVIAGNIAVLFGFLIVFFVFKENSYTSAIVEIADNQKVISTGLYAFVRHPMYSGGLLLLFFTPIALGSWYGLPLFLPMFIVIILRLLDEEKLLYQNLPDYKEYCQKVRYRLIPYIW